MTQPLVSIIIPVHNAGENLEMAMRSAIGQSWPNVEILIVDDGSTDNSIEVASRFETGKVTIFRQENMGASAARNLGLKKARGKYIQFLDSDDILSPEKIELQVLALEEKHGYVAVCSTVHFKNGDDYRLGTPSLDEDEFIYSTEDPASFLIKLWGGYDFKASMIQPNSWLSPRSLIEQQGHWNERLTVDDDGEFFSRIVLNANGVIKTGGLNYYRKYPVSKRNLSSQKTTVNLQSALNAIKLKKEHLFKVRSDEFAKKAIYRLLMELSVICYNFEPLVYKEVCREINTLPNFKYRVLIGGSAINKIAQITGWRFAKRLQQSLSKLRKIK